MAVYDCLDCGLASERRKLKESYIEHPDHGVIDGMFASCTNCSSLDVDVYSDEGWQIEMRCRETLERGGL